MAATFQGKRGLTGSAETIRRWGHAVGWVWKRATRVGKDDDPHRVVRLARIRFVYEQWRLSEALVCADELAIHLWPKVGSAWMPPGTQVEVMPPGSHEKPYLAGALALATGTWPHTRGPRQTTALFRGLLQRLDEADPAPHDRRIDGVVDHDTIHTAKAGEPWLAMHPRVERLLLPTDGPRANPIERAVGDVHDLCTRNHTRKRLRALGADVVEHLPAHGPWRYPRSDIYAEPAVTAAGQRMTMAPTRVAAD